jgi:integrase
MYLVQKLMIEYGLRVNTPAGLKVKDLLFLDGETFKIVLPDIKVRSERCEDIDEEFAHEIEGFLEDKEDLGDEDYVFYQEGKNASMARRARELCVKVNHLIRISKVLKKNPRFKYSSHMFRKTKANTIFQEGLKELKEKSRRAIGQKSNSSAIEHYININ